MEKGLLGGDNGSYYCKVIQGADEIGLRLFFE